MSKHTPGPWMVGEWIGKCHKPEHGYNHPGESGDNPCVYDPVFYAGGSIAAKGGVNVIKCEYGDLSISDADLSLIAAAPDLLEALDYALSALANCRADKGYGSMQSRAANLAANAIAKARGEA